MIEQFLDCEFKEIPDFNCGLIKIIKQKYIGNKFFVNRNYFKSTNGWRLCSSCTPMCHPGTKELFVIGNVLHNDQCIAITDLFVFRQIVQAIKEYNIKMNEIEHANEENIIIDDKIIDYFSLHKETWLIISKLLPPYTIESKSEITKQICKREKIYKVYNSCFLCEFIKKTYSELDCKKCVLKTCEPSTRNSDNLYMQWYNSVSSGNWTEASKAAFAIAHAVD